MKIHNFTNSQHIFCPDYFTTPIEGVDDVWFRFSFSDSGASGAVDICGSVTTVWDEVNRKGKVKLFISRKNDMSHIIWSISYESRRDKN